MSDKIYKVGIASLVHDHIWSLCRNFSEHPQCQVVAVGEEDEGLRTRMRGVIPGIREYTDWHEMFEKEPLDIVIITSENARTADIAEVAAAHKVNICIEKPISATLAQADRILKAAKDNGVMLFVNWATNWSPAAQTAFRLIREGAIGQLYDARIHMAHRGPKEIGCEEHFWKWLYTPELNGAGAYMDYCCYGADIIRLLFGMPKSVMGWRQILVKDYLPANSDDNGMVVCFYDNAVARAEASWCEIPGYHDAIFHGSKGKVITDSGKVLMSVDPSKPLTEVPLDTLPPQYKNAAWNFVYCLENGVEPDGMCNAQVSRDAQEILEAGLISDREGRRITLPLA